MFENRNLDRWHAAGLLDDGARDRIRAWEAAHARPVWLWALAGAGAFAIVLGVVALVAANWNAIPGGVKIGGHLVLDAALACGVFLACRFDKDRARELLALLLFGVVLSGIGLVGQVYQLGGTAWQGLLTWMVACTPFLVLTTRSGLVAIAWVSGLAVTYAYAFPLMAALLDRDDGGIALVWMPVMALLALGLVRRSLPGGQVQGAWMIGAARIALLGAASLPQVMLRVGGAADLDPVASELGWGLAATVALLPVLGLDRWRRGRWDVVTTALAAAGWITWWSTSAAWTALQPDGAIPAGEDGRQLAIGLIFLAFWMLVSWLALRSGRRGLFAAAFTVIALRVFLFYWEAFGSLLSTGFGLLAGGMLCIGLAALGWRIVRRLHPGMAAR